MFEEEICNTAKSSKKTKSYIAESERADAHKKQLALFLQLTGLIKVRELGFFCNVHSLVWVGLVIEFERIIGVREVLLRLFFDFPVGFDPIKKLGAVARVFGHSGSISFSGFVMALFLFQGGLSAVAGQICSKIVAAGESSGVKNRASDHHCNACDRV